MNQWSEQDWYRRTGYVRRDGERLFIQLREGEQPQSAGEVEHYDFARDHGFSWLNKPNWR